MQQHNVRPIETADCEAGQNRMERSVSGSLPLYFWAGRAEFAGRPNFGDILSKSIVEWISTYPICPVKENENKKLLAIGSILERARNGDIVWGSGIHPRAHDQYWTKQNNQKWYQKWYRKSKPIESDIKVWAVRGPISRDALLHRGIACPEIFGDPGLLVSDMHPLNRNPIRKYGIIPHYRDEPEFQNKGIPVISPLQDWRAVAEEIVRCEYIISSSLHGIIVAESYGVPAIWLRTLSGEGFIKYLDYYLGTNRFVEPVYDIEDASLNRPGVLPDLSPIKKGLREAFDNKQLQNILLAR